MSPMASTVALARAVFFLSYLSKSQSVERTNLFSSELILNPTHETIYRGIGEDESSAVAGDELIYSLADEHYIDSVLSFDLSYASNLEHVTLAILKLYALSGDLNATRIDVDEEKFHGSLGSAVINDAKCNSIPCWVEVDITAWLLWGTEHASQLSELIIDISADQPTYGSFAASSYNGGRYAPKLTLDFRNQALQAIEMLRASTLKGSNPTSEKKNKTKKKKPKRKNKKKKDKPSGKKDKPKNPANSKPGGKNKPSSNGGKKDNPKKPSNSKPGGKFKPNDGGGKKEKPKTPANSKPGGKKPSKFGPGKNKPSGNGSKNKPGGKTPSKPANKPVRPVASSNSKPKPSPTNASEPKPRPTDDIGSNSVDKPKPPAPAPPKTPPLSPTAASKETLKILQSREDVITEQLLMYDDRTLGKIQSVYTFDGLMNGLSVMSSKGVAGKTFYLGNDDKDKGSMYGLVNIAAFLAQSMKETIKYNACDENSWDLVDGKYPLSNACGQLGQSYQDYHCPANEKHMECPVDPDMELTAVTHATWYGAPGPLFCRPKKSKNDFTGYWDYQFDCNNPWADPPLSCDVYPNQKAGMYNNSIPVANSGGRTDTEGCCWWGRGVIQTTGICNFGKLNYFLGARAQREGRSSAYPDIDFCKNPEAICSSQKYKELKWIAGMFYWMESLQSYDSKGWNYMDQLHAFVDGGYSDYSFINAVSGIVNRGCHDPPCGTGEVDGVLERSGYFSTVLSLLM
jgi:predicted chitinase